MIPPLTRLTQRLKRAFRRAPQPSLPPLRPAASTAAQADEFRRRVVTVAEGVHVAIGYGLANAILLEGTDRTILVDTLESVEAAREVKAAFDKLSAKPLQAIILTHHHTDHISGAGVWGADQPLEVIAHATLTAQMDRVAGILRPIISRRSLRQFGVYLGEAAAGAGIGLALRTNAQASMAPLRPTRTFDEQLNLEIAGLRLELIHTPGETDDQISIWLPDKRVMISADNYYRAFPNLYAIRGTAYRDVMQWVHSLDRVRDYRPDILIPGHGRPVFGAETIYLALTDYRDAIQYVHDQTVRGMNAGLTPDELVARLQLPPHLAQSPHLVEVYGSVAWSARAIFDGYLGWFNGQPSSLEPLPPARRAAHLSALAGGVEGLHQAAAHALAAHEWQWALELTDAALGLDSADSVARQQRVQALTALGDGHPNANARNYYLTAALELQGLEIPIIRPSQSAPAVIQAMPLSLFFAALAVRLNPDKSQAVDQCVGFHFPDCATDYTLHVRRGVAEVRPRFPERPDITVTLPSTLWKEMLAGLRSPATTLVRGEVQVTGGVWSLAQVLALFEQD